MPVSRDQRRSARAARASQLFRNSAEPALDLLDLTDLAWHDCYGDPSPPDEVLEDIWAVSDGDLAKLAQAARLAVIDRRDLRLWADGLRTRPLRRDELPHAIADEVAGWPEFRMGVHRIRVELADGRVFEHVMESAGRVVKLLGHDGIPFDARDVVAVTDFAEEPLPPGY